MGNPYLGGSFAPVSEELTLTELEQRTITRSDLGAAAQVGEFVFVPQYEKSAEEDGLLLGFVYDMEPAAVALSMLDAAGLDTAPRSPKPSLP